jgi:glyoxalase family protein
VPAEHALRGFAGVRAYAHDAEPSRPLLERALAFQPAGDGWEVRGEHRGSTYAYDPPPNQPGIQGAGTVHHVAWATPPEDQGAWRERVLHAGGRPTPVIDRFYFKSVYFREPSGVLFEIATIGPGFTADEPFETLGERLSLPPDFEHLREQIEATVTPLPSPRGG